MRHTVWRSTMLAGAGALYLLVPSAALAVKSGVWSGTTSQTNLSNHSPMQITFEVSANRITVLDFGADFSGRSGCSAVDSAYAERLASKNGFAGLKIVRNHFGSGNAHPNSGDHISITGEFNGSKATGSLTDSFATGTEHCSTGKVSFSAKPGGSLLP